MIEGIIGIGLIVWFCFNGDVQYLIAAALFIIASNISYIEPKERKK
jgi:hypothetical protein